MNLETRSAVKAGGLVVIGALLLLALLLYAISMFAWPSAVIAWGLRAFVTAPLVAFAALISLEENVSLPVRAREVASAALRDRCAACGAVASDEGACVACGAPAGLDCAWAPTTNRARGLFVASLTASMFAGAAVLGAAAWAVASSTPGRIALAAASAFVAWIGFASLRSTRARAPQPDASRGGISGSTGWIQGDARGYVSIRVTPYDDAVLVEGESHLERPIRDAEPGAATPWERALAWRLHRASATRALHPYRVLVRRWTLRLLCGPEAPRHYRQGGRVESTSDVVDGVRVGQLAEASAALAAELEGSSIALRVDGAWLAPIRVVIEASPAQVEAIRAEEPDESEFRDPDLRRWLAAVRSTSK